jgi:hypothetical protein
MQHDSRIPLYLSFPFGPAPSRVWFLCATSNNNNADVWINKWIKDSSGGKGEGGRRREAANKPTAPGLLVFGRPFNPD